MACRQQVAAVLLSLEDELAVLDLRYADLLQSLQSLSGSDEDDVEVRSALLHQGCGHYMRSWFPTRYTEGTTAR